MAVVALFASTAAAQLSDYLGPGVTTYGAGQIGQRSGQEVNLRFYADASGFYDSALQAPSVNSQGKLVQASGSGEELGFGAYGTYQWRHSQLGLDYRGVFRNYTTNTYYDGIDQQIILGYTVQKSRRVYFDISAVGGTISRGIGELAGYPIPIPTYIAQPASMLFDNRTYYGQGQADMTYLVSARTSFTVGGGGFVARRRSDALAGVDGYVARGSIQRRFTRSTTLGAAYEHVHFAYTQAFGDSDINNYEGFLGTQLGRRWTLSARAGVFEAEANGIQQVAVSPVISALLGITTTTEAFYTRHIFPSIDGSLTRVFKNANLSFAYAKTASPGNGVYLASRQENAWIVFSYTGLRKINFTFFGGGTRFNSFGQNLPSYWQANGGAGLTYSLTRALHVTARYDARYERIQASGYSPTAYRVTLGVAYSPGTLPLLR
ncbi:MAG: hypothetical protein JO307_22265 [Bryobacterales bacterium]|nr:hypothetical protein [Bryobacterales bacterium]